MLKNVRMGDIAALIALLSNFAVALLFWWIL